MITKYLLPVLAVFGLGFAILTVINGSKTIPPAQPFVDPAAPPFKSSVAGTGIVEANTENIAIGTLVPGVVSEIFVSVGSEVKAGDSLFKLDDRDLIAQQAVRQTALRVAEAGVKVEKASLADLKNQFEKAKLAKAKADFISEKAKKKETETTLDRIIVRAPVDGEILQLKIHPGEFAPAGVTQTPLILFGNVKPLNVRVDVDENDAWRVRADAPAVAFLRGNREIKTNLKFVRFEPYIVPKKSLTGDSIERVDTRVLQVIYNITQTDLPIFAGQQMDVYIESPDPLQKSDIISQIEQAKQTGQSHE